MRVFPGWNTNLETVAHIREEGSTWSNFESLKYHFLKTVCLIWDVKFHDFEKITAAKVLLELQQNRILYLRGP